MPNNSIKGFKVGNEVKKYDYNELDNLPENDPDDLAEQIGDLKSEINDINKEIGKTTVSKSLNTGNVTYTGANDAKIDVAASTGDKIVLTFSGDALTDASSGRLYIQNVGGAYSSVLAIADINAKTEYTLSNDIVAVGFTAGSLNKNSQITGTFDIISTNAGLHAEIKNLREDVPNIVENANLFVKKSEYDSNNTISEMITINFRFAGDRLVCRYGLISNAEKIVIVSVPNGISYGVQEYSAPIYDAAHRVYDSGWQTTSGFEREVTEQKYFYFVLKNTDNTPITDISVADDFGIEHILEAKAQIVQNKTDIQKIKDTVPVVLSTTVKTVGHRGDQIDAPRNTAPAYIEARKRGILIAENDVTISSDNQYVCWHDTNFAICGNLVDINGYLMYTDGTDFYYVKNNTAYTWNGTSYETSATSLASLTRCAGSNYTPESLTLAELKRIDVGVYKGSSFVGTQILTFTEWVLLCKQLGMGIYVDRKIDWTDAQLTELAQIVNRLGMGEYSSWLSIYGSQIPILRAVISDARVGIPSHPSDDNVVAYAQYNTGRGVFFNGNAKSGLSASVVQKGLDAGYQVEAYYVDYGNSDTEADILEAIRTAVGYGLTGLTLDHYTVDDAFAYLLE